MKWLCLVAALFLFAGCGDVNWFPDGTSTPATGNATGPAPFTFTPGTATIAQANSVVLSNEITITGDNPNGWTISFANTPTTVVAEAMIDGDLKIRDLFPNPVIKPGQRLAIEQSIPNTVKTGDKLTTIVTIGTTTGQFVTTIQ